MEGRVNSAEPDMPVDLNPPADALIKHETGTWVWRATDSDGRPVVVKLYRHRGVATALRSRLFRFRVEREYRRLQHLEHHGLPCTRALDWGAGRSEQHGHHEWLVTAEVPGAVQLRHHLLDGGATDLLEPLYRTARQMHESGFCCQTLFASNVLVSGEAAGASHCVLADVPRSWTFPGSIAGTRMAWFDLLDLTLSVVETGVPARSVPLEAYGLGDRGRRWWTPRGPGAPGGALESRAKSVRQTRDAFVRLRWAAAWMQHALTFGWRRR